MVRFKVKIRRPNDTETTEYIIDHTSHDNTNVNAAIKALQTFADHGHTRFPYNDDELTLHIEEVRDVA